MTTCGSQPWCVSESPGAYKGPAPAPASIDLTAYVSWLSLCSAPAQGGVWETEDPPRHAFARPRTPEGPARLLGRGQTFLWAILTPFNSSLKFANGCERPSAGEVGHRQPFSRTRTELGFNFGAVGFPEGSRPHKAICRWRLQANGGKAVLCSPHGRHPPPEGSPAPCGGQGALPHLCPCPLETPRSAAQRTLQLRGHQPWEQNPAST